MKIREATKSFEDWLSDHIPLIRNELTLKHESMAKDEFYFLRGSFYRWAQTWPLVCQDLCRAPTVLAVGDLHVNSFGTWRDQAGRLVWGIDDFDEAYPLPYTNDLVRLATSARLAIALDHLATKPKDACDAILEGYASAIKCGGTPIVLEDKNGWLASTARSRLDDPPSFWAKLASRASVKIVLPDGVVKTWKTLFPEPRLPYRIVRRCAGMGSLAHPRFVAIAEWRGGKIALEAKMLAPSACVWSHAEKGKRRIYYGEVLRQAVRCPDPFARATGNWIVKRLAPDSSPVDIGSMPRQKEEGRLLCAMGWETANIHLGTRGAAGRIRNDLRHRNAKWLRIASKTMAKAITKDWEQWRKL